MELLTSEFTVQEPPFRLLLVGGATSTLVGSPWEALDNQEEWHLTLTTEADTFVEKWSEDMDALVFCSTLDLSAFQPRLQSFQEDYPHIPILCYSAEGVTSSALTTELSVPLIGLASSLPEEFFRQTLLSAVQKSRAQKQQNALLSELQKQNEQLEFQNEIISALQNIQFESEESFRSLLERIGEQLLALDGIVCVRVRVKASYLLEEYRLGLEGMHLPWTGAPIPEDQVPQDFEGILLRPDELSRSYPHLHFESLFFFGLRIQDPQQRLQGTLGLYLKEDESALWSEEMVRLVARKVSLLVSNKVAELETRRTYDTLMELASYNMSLMANYGAQGNQELDHYRRTLDQLLARSSEDLLPQQAVIIRQNDRNDLRATPFHRNEQGKVVVMAPTLNAMKLQSLFPPTSEGCSRNLSIEEIHEQSTLFPRELFELMGPIRNYVYCSLHLIQGNVDTLVLFNYGRTVRDKDAALLMAFSLPLSFQIGFSRETKHRRRTQIVAMAKLAELAEKRDDETGAHLKRIAHYSRVLAEDLAAAYSPYSRDIDAEFIREIYESSPLHDIGKVGIEDSVLCKPGRLTDEEYEIMKTHTLIGAEVLEGVEFLEMARDIALCHHEKFDGTGYPRGLAGTDIPLAARIVTLADVYDAITSRRVYRQQPFTHEEAKSLLLREYGRHFDPAVVDAFLRCEQLFVKIREKYNPI